MLPVTGGWNDRLHGKKRLDLGESGSRDGTKVAPF